MVHKYVDTFQTNMSRRGTSFVTRQPPWLSGGLPHLLPMARTTKTEVRNDIYPVNSERALIIRSHPSLCADCKYLPFCIGPAVR